MLGKVTGFLTFNRMKSDVRLCAKYFALLLWIKVVPFRFSLPASSLLCTGIKWTVTTSKWSIRAAHMWCVAMQRQTEKERLRENDKGQSMQTVKKIKKINKWQTVLTSWWASTRRMSTTHWRWPSSCHKNISSDFAFPEGSVTHVQVCWLREFGEESHSDKRLLRYFIYISCCMFMCDVCMCGWDVSVFVWPAFVPPAHSSLHSIAELVPVYYCPF